MREILFRGKDFVFGNWVEGFYFTAKTDQGTVVAIDSGDEVCQVIPETVGQYTGLTDKNGTRIFEGDIVRYVIVDIDGSEDAYIGAICFEPEKVGFAIKRDDYRAFFVNSWLIDIEVIGNIYDNPELMVGEAHG